MCGDTRSILHSMLVGFQSVINFTVKLMSTFNLYVHCCLSGCLKLVIYTKWMLSTRVLVKVCWTCRLTWSNKNIVSCNLVFMSCVYIMYLVSYPYVLTALIIYTALNATLKLHLYSIYKCSLQSTRGHSGHLPATQSSINAESKCHFTIKTLIIMSGHSYATPQYIGTLLTFYIIQDVWPIDV